MASHGKNILVTGAAGVLGREVCSQLVSKGHSVTGVDNNKRFPNSKPDGRFIKSDLGKFLNLTANKFDFIYHMAAINGTASFYSQPNEVLTNNVLTDLDIFKFAETNPNTKLIYASSSEVVSGTTIFPTPEIVDIVVDNIHNPRWSYRLPKMLAENYLTNSKINYNIVRFFNIYSEHCGAGHFLKDIVSKIKNQNYHLQSPEETRSFCYVKDAVDAMIFVAEQTSNNIVNIGSDEEITILEAANIIATALDIPAQWKTIDSLPGSSLRRRPDITKLLEIYPTFKPESFANVIQRIKDIL
jgi:nucleoside-diphosphate-sugar epimerase